MDWFSLMFLIFFLIPMENVLVDVDGQRIVKLNWTNPQRCHVLRERKTSMWKKQIGIYYHIVSCSEYINNTIQNWLELTYFHFFSRQSLRNRWRVQKKFNKFHVWIWFRLSERNHNLTQYSFIPFNANNECTTDKVWIATKRKSFVQVSCFVISALALQLYAVSVARCDVDVNVLLLFICFHIFVYIEFAIHVKYSCSKFRVLFQRIIMWFINNYYDKLISVLRVCIRRNKSILRFNYFQACGIWKKTSAHTHCDRQW